MRNLSQRRWRLIAAVILAVATLFSNSNLSSAGQQTNSELRQDINQLNAVLSTRNLNALQLLVGRASVKWQKRDHSSYVTYMRTACSILSGHDVGDISVRAKLLDRYSRAVIDGGNLSLAENIEFVRFLALDPLNIDEASWKQMREQKARLWLTARKRVEASIDPRFDINDRAFINVPVPLGSGVPYPSGIAPEAIQ
jgi:hypothetical protein